MWRYFKGQHFSFWMICFYLFFEYTRPQSIFPIIDVLPWSSLFLIGSLIGAFSDPTVKWVASPVNVFISLFAIVIFLSSVTAYYPDISQKYYIYFYSWYVIYFLIISIINTKQRLYIFVIIFLLSAAKIAIGTSKVWAFRGFSFTSWGLSGPQGYFQNSGELAILMLTLFPIAYLLYNFLKNKVSKFERYLLILFWVTPLLTILGASSRGSQLALAIQLCIIYRKSVFKLKSLLGVIFLVSILYNIIPEEQMNRLESSGDDKSSIQRLLYWEHGLEMIKTHPFLGVGYFNFPQYFGYHYPEDVLYGVAQLPHNIFIQVGTDVGVLGLLLFLLLLSAPFILALKVNRLNTINNNFMVVVIVGTAYGIFGYIVAGQFVSVAYYPFFWIGLSTIVSGVNVLKLTEKQQT